MLIDHSIKLSSTRPRVSVWRLLDWIYPPACCNCGRIGFEVCPDCFSQIELLETRRICRICGKLVKRNSICRNCANDPPAFIQLRSWGVYAGVLQQIVKRIKYERGIGLVEYLTTPLSHGITQWGIPFDMIVPVPLNPNRQRSRGYNQAALISKPLSKRLNIPCCPPALVRIKDTRSQVGLNAVQRRENMAGAFRAEHDICKGKTVLLVDDIATTGSTLNECATALKQAGAERIYCYTIARTASQLNLKQEMEVYE